MNRILRQDEVHWKTRRTLLAHIAMLESALQLIGNELSLHADQGPAGKAFRALLNTTFAAESPVSREGVKP